MRRTRRTAPTIECRRPSVRISTRKYDLAGLPTRFMWPGEVETLLSLMESVSARVVVEFGVHAGRNPAAALRNLSTIERYVGVDVLPGYVTQMSAQRAEIPERPGHLAQDDHRFELILRPRGSFDLTAADLPAGVDVVFIDGDHSALGVRNDYALALEILRPRGLVIFHDDNGLPVVEVTQTLNELCDQGAQIIKVDGTWLAYEMIGA